MKMKIIPLFVSLCLGFVPILDRLHGQAPVEGAGRGAVIIASKAGPTQFLDSRGKKLAAEKTAVGGALPEGYVAQAGIGGKIVLLLSNGTAMTLESQTKLKIREFTQEPFDAAGRKVSDLKAEPSKSNVKLDLDWGSIVVVTKKLDRKSSMDIYSPVGVAGIRGTQFQMSQEPGTGVKLDVAESTVAFTPPKGAPTVPVAAGRGLDVAMTGVALPRLINPAVARNIASVNAAALRMTSNLSLTAVASAMTEAAAEAASSSGEGEGDGESDGDGEGDGGDDSGGDDSGGDDSGGDDSGGDDGGGDGGGDSSSGGDSGGDSGGGDGGSGAAPAAASAPAVDTSQVLENNSEAKQSRKMGKVSAVAREATRLGLTDKQAEIFYSYDSGIQNALLAIDTEVVKRLLDLTDKGVLAAHLKTFFGYAQETQAKMLELQDDTALANLIVKQYEEDWLTVLISDQNLLALNAGGSPESLPDSTDQQEFLTLADNLRESGNADILDELLELGGGTLTDDLLSEGEIANQLLAEFSVAGDLSGTSLVNGQDALSNRFYQDVSSLYETLEEDALVAGQAAFLGGRTMTLAGGAYSLDGLGLGSSDALAFGAVDRLRLEGAIEFSGDAGVGKRIVLMSGNELEASSALTLDAATNDLVLSVRRDILLEGATAELPVVLRGVSEVAIQSLRDVTLRNTEMKAPDLVTIKAAKELYVDNMSFSDNLLNLKIVMEATTIRLMNIDFPSTATVNLNSLKGGIDGGYPNFGTSVSAAEQLGRVNFLQNVKAGGNLMHDRPSFDQFGGNITIGKSK